MKILVAEDDPVSRRVLEVVLARLGHACDVVEDCEQAWELFQRVRPDVLITDWMMPALCDVDRFKAYNDHEGHLAGDEVLRAVAQALARECRTTDAAYRFGGEEILLVLPEQSEETALVALERMRGAVAGLAIPHPGSQPRARRRHRGGGALISAGRVRSEWGAMTRSGFAAQDGPPI